MRRLDFFNDLPQLFRFISSATLVSCVAASCVISWRWPLVGDAPLFHYIVFLVQHGMAPYRDIKDPNLPATYVIEALVMNVFGPGALAWRIWDWTLVLAVGAGIFSICKPYGRYPALFATALFALIHARDGLIQLGQRDLLLTALIVLSYALLFHSLRHPQEHRALAMCGLGALLGCATMVKPIALCLLACLLCWLALTHRSDNQHVYKQIAAAVGGAALAVIAAFLFLGRWHAVHAFWDVMTHLVPLHAAIGRRRWSWLLLQSVSSVMLPIFLIWLPVFVGRRSWRNPETALLLLGFMFGVLSFCLQGRGYPYHRYPSEAFLLMLMGMDLSAALSSKGQISRGLAWAAISFATMVTAPRSVDEIGRFDWKSNVFDDSLQSALAKVGDENLNHNVQCLDVAGGCINTLLHRQLVQSTGYLYDCYLFDPLDSARAQEEQRWYRRGFMAAMVAHSPQYVIVTSDECGIGPSNFLYRKLSYWPELNKLISDHYSDLSMAADA